MAQGTNIDKSEHYGELQQVIDRLFEDAAADLPRSDEEAIAAVEVSRLQVVLAAESTDLPEDLLCIVNLLPPGSYTRDRLVTQLNSAIIGHAWGQVYGTLS